MTLDEAREFALSLPEATEEPHFEYSSYRVGKKIFATVPPDGLHLHIFMEEHAVHAMVAEDPAAFAELWWGQRLCGVRVHLPAADAMVICELLEEAWRRKAPKRLIATLATQKNASGNLHSSPEA